MSEELLHVKGVFDGTNVFDWFFMEDKILVLRVVSALWGVIPAALVYFILQALTASRVFDVLLAAFLGIASARIVAYRNRRKYREAGSDDEVYKDSRNHVIRYGDVTKAELKKKRGGDSILTLYWKDKSKRITIHGYLMEYGLVQENFSKLLGGKLTVT